MKNVMAQAWEIARKGQEMFGGKVKEYFAEALRQAWIIVKKGMEKFKDVVVKSSSRDWMNYGKHRLYIDAEISLVELKEIKGNLVGAKRGLVGKYYYDWKSGKLFVQDYRGKDLSAADDEVVAYMEAEIKKLVNKEIENSRAYAMKRQKEAYEAL